MNKQQRFEDFTAELTELSKKHGIAIKAIGGVYIADNAAELANITYSQDASSGDLEWEC
jgi:hypothetical protein